MPVSTPAKTIRFICCTKPIMDCIGPEGVIVDAEGFMVCPEHKERRYGWRTVRKETWQGEPDAETGIKATIEHPVWGESDIERDRLIQRELFPVGEEEEE